ncbi:polyketide synthase dehydratase domain-containing protein, partial [Lactobacillus crispatus]|uniref:polyketide synthase dehydratase domain-containing protein n=1 Tax=Lactobacillus crispatus TaxID=47770 RepID=UPI001F10ACE9
MARAAVVAATGADPETGIRLEHVTWLRPAVVGADGLVLHIDLFADDQKRITYEIYGGTPENEGDDDRIVYSQGHASLWPPAETPAADIALIRTQCADSSLSAQNCYARYARQGLDYGEAFRGVKALSIGTDSIGRRQVLG